MTVIQAYDAAIARQDIVDDPMQRGIITHLQRVADALVASPKRTWFGSKRKRALVKGLYLYGPVGVGKSFLIDLFYECVGESRKARFHFHEFMQQIDAQLRNLQGQKNPLQLIAKNLAKTTRLLCLDEFLVNDVAYAMILAELFQALFAQGIVLVVSSNTAPDELYLHGVQRDRFLPVIALIKTHCQICTLSEYCDYRLGRAPMLQAYVYPLNQATEKTLADAFDTLPGKTSDKTSLTIQNRSIPCVKCRENAVWFRFDTICNLPRSQLDYLEIAERFDTVFVSDIPCLTPNHTAQVILLIHFIDVMYDRGIRLIVSAATPLERLYVTGDMRREFQRTLSRMEEMQSEDYLRRHQRRHPQYF